MVDAQVNIGTDVAALFLFHPEDLAHRAHAPIAWYGYDFAYRRESSAGRMVAWSTGSDGGYLVRLTTGSLTEAERPRASAGFAFPLVVRHGRIFVDNGDGLPGEEQMDQPDDLPARWVDVPTGSYRVTIHSIDRGDGGNELADYVLRFEPVDRTDAVGVAATLPELNPWVKAPPVMAAAAPLQNDNAMPFLWRDAPEARAELGAVIVPADTRLVPGGSRSIPVSEALAEHHYPKDHPDVLPPGPLLATAIAPGQLGLATEVNGRSWSRGMGDHISVRVTAVVRIASAQGDAVRVEPVARPDLDLDAGRAATFRARLLAEVAPAEAGETIGRLTAPGFELERLETFASAESVTGWALTWLAMPLDTRMRLWVSSAAERVAGIEALLDG